MNRTPFISALALALLVPIVAHADDAKPPIRHLEFDTHVTITAMSTQEGFNSFGSDVASDGVNEKISVDVLAVVNDGSLLVRAQAQREHADRPDAPVTCAVYGDGRVRCSGESRVTEEMMLLLGTLGRGWYDPTIVSNGTWNRELDFKSMVVKSSYKRGSAEGTNPMQVFEHTDVVSTGAINTGSTSDTRITYDTALSVPLTIHDEEHPKSGSVGTYVLTDIKLVNDSLAKH